MFPGAHVQAHFSTRAEIPFRLNGTFLDFQARLAGVKILAWFKSTGLRFSARAELCPRLNPSLHVIGNLILREFVSEAGLKFQPGMKFAM